MSSESSGLELNWQPENQEQALLQEALGLLATRMQIWDELKVREQKLNTQRHELQPLLDSIDFDKSAELHPSEVAFAALGAYILDAKISEVGRALRSHDYEILLQSWEIRGKKVEITSLDERYEIGTSRMNEYGQLNGLSKWHHSKKGKIIDLSLHPGSGGHIQIQGFGNKVYSADPLIDRHNEYRPAFDIRFLK